MNIVEEYRTVVTTLLAAKVDFAVCGGFAMAMHGHSRFTTDIDLLIPPEELDRAIETLKSAGFEFDSENIPFSTATIRRIVKALGSDHLVLDMMLVEGWLVPIWKKRVAIEWEGLNVPTVSALGLAKMKRVAGRHKDLADIESLGYSPDDPKLQP